MKSPLRHLTTIRRARALAFRGAGFTLIEIVIALAVLGTMAAGVYVGFNAINTYAVSSRLYTEAVTAAQNQIDLILSKEPFNITTAYISGSFNPNLNKIPVEVMTVAELDSLASSGVSFPTAPPASTPAPTSSYFPYYPYYRTGSGQPLKKQAFIYRDPVSGNVLVTGTLTSTVTDASVTDPGMSMTYGAATANLNARRANVTVAYSFRRITDSLGATQHGDYTVSMDTLRTADQ